MNDKAFKLPDFTVEEVFEVYSRSTVKQTIGWGLIESNVPQAWISSEGEGIKTMVIDTGMPNHLDIKNTSPITQNNSP